MKLYLDVDGVINAFRASEEWGFNSIEGWDYGSEEVLGYPVMWSEEMVARLLELHAEYPSLELVWVSTWQDDCRKVAEVVGLGDWGMNAKILRPLGGAVSFPSVYWKVEAIWEDSRIGFGREHWAWFDSGVWELRDNAEYSGFLSTPGSFVPSVNADWGIGRDMLVTLELILEAAEAEGEKR